MLGVLKRRWKPKRASNGGRLSVDIPPTTEYIGEKPRCVPVPCARQVHPACEDRTVLAYDIVENNSHNHTHHSHTHPHSLHPPTSPPAYPLAPNICVEAGRIEFIKTPTDGDGGGICNGVGIGTGDDREEKGVGEEKIGDEKQVATTATQGTKRKVTVTRAQQTTDEKYDVAKESLEARILELEEALEAAKITELRDKQTLMKLQKQLSKRESCARDVERERRLRAESEARVREAAADAARCRTRLKLLTHEFARMEETVRAMLVYKSRAEQLKQEKQALAIAFESRTQQYQSTLGRLNAEVSSLRQQLDACPAAAVADGRVAALEADNAALCRAAEATRRQYERCLDDVANQVVRALLAQKNLREEISGLTRRIKDLETQNRALTTLLVHQLRGDNSDVDVTPKPQLALESSTSEKESTSQSDMQSSSNSSDHNALLPNSPNDSDLTLKHCNSFNSDILNETKISPECERVLVNEIISKASEKHLSADADIFETRFSLEDKKRHHILAKLWTELKGAEVTPQRLLDALSAVDSSLWVPPQRPVSLNLQLPVFQNAKCHRRSTLLLAQSNSKSEEETGNESPESGNRDEGYSTMSSDVQEVNRVSGEAVRGLEDLKEATDETDLPETRIMVVEDQCDPDILFIPLNFALGINPRNSFPPSKGILPFQHIMRSFSDSHLCLKITTAPSPCYSLSSPMSSSPSILLLDITDKSLNPLRRTKATTLISSVEYPEEESHSRISWCSGQDEHDYPTWDTEYVQQWLRLDESRTALQQHQRDLLELEYDRAELEDWSLSLSSEDVHEPIWRKSNEIMTPGQYSLSTLPSIQENNALELEEDSNECLWNNSSYMADKVGGELVALLMDASVNNESEKRWPYAVNGNQNLTSPGDSWSSAETNSEDCFHNYEQETCSKRSSAALSGCSDETNESHPVGTDFTRDFYRLVKYESTKSLASISSKSAAGCLPEHCDREQVLQNVLTFIAEQQKYCNNREESDSRPSSVHHEEPTKDFSIEAPQQNLEEISSTPNESELTNCCDSAKYNENYVNFKQLRAELALNEQNSNKETTECTLNTLICDESSYLDSSVQNSLIESFSQDSTLTNNDSCDCSSDNTKVNEELGTDLSNSDSPDAKTVTDLNTSISELSDRDHLSPSSGMTESQTSSVSTPDTVVSRIPRRQISKSSTPLKTSSPKASPTHSKKIPQPIQQAKPAMKSKIPAKDLRNSKPKSKSTKPSLLKEPSKPIITSERLPQCTSGLLGSSVIDGPPHRAVSFHERATSKDVIDELNRMIRKGEENGLVQEAENSAEKIAKLDEACRPTGWIHVEKTEDLNDPKARASLLDVMMTSSDSSPTSSCGGSVSSESTDDPPDYGHLHRIHRFNRQKKASAVRPQLAVLRCVPTTPRPCIIGRDDFFVRYGEKEKEAVSSFDFLDDFSTGSLTSSIDEELAESVLEET